MVSFSHLFVAATMATTALAAPHRAHEFFHKKRATSSKMGAAYNDASVIATLTGAAWAYDWNYSPDGTVPEGVEYCPMLWGSKMFNGWQSAVQTAIAGGSKCILGFNEPDLPAQANMAPVDAMNAYKQYITPFKDQATLVTPAVTNSGSAGQGLDWMDKYLTACAGTCGQTAMAIHWYGPADINSFQQYVNQAIALARKHGIFKVWMTEFAATTDAASQAQFLQQAIPWLNSQDAVERYAYFMAGDGTLLNGNALSTIGQALVAAN
jgi:hypothetical protein